MNFFVEQAVLDVGVKILFAEIRGVDNHAVTPEWITYRQRKLSDLFARYENLDVHSDPVLEGFNVLHDRVGVKRRKNVPASENLIKLLEKHHDLPLINQAVDIYNLVSLESKLALGAHDLEKVDGAITLRFADGLERFVPIGQEEPVPVEKGEYCYCDDAHEVLCRLEIRQVEKTKVDEDSHNIGYIVQGNDRTDTAFLWQTANKLIQATTRACGGEGRVVEPTVIRTDAR